MRVFVWIWLLGVAAGCSSDKASDTADASVGGGEADADTDTDTDSDTDVDTDTDFDGKLNITSPDDGAEIEGGAIAIEFTVEGCTVGSPSEVPDGCHLHKYMDGLAYEEPDGGGGFGHYSTSGFTMLVETNGTHEVGLLLIRNDGSDQPFSPSISDTVTVNVSGLPEDTGSWGDTGTSDDTGDPDDTGASDDTGTSGDTGTSSDTGAAAADTGGASSGTTAGDDTGAASSDPEVPGG